MTVDYAENTLKATSILIDKKLNSLSFDKTIQATVVDASKAQDGIYTVFNGGANFIAYSSETGYKKNDSVMVMIPEGNYDNEKIIIGKSTGENNADSPLIYRSPFDNFIDLSNNLIDDDTTVAFLANGNGTKEENNNDYKWEMETNLSSDNLIFHYPDTNQTENIQIGYTQIGLRAKFSTKLEIYDAISGNYGLALEVKFKNPNLSEENNSEPDENTSPNEENNSESDENTNANEDFTKLFFLDSSSFFGNVYNFNFFQTQEILFDISEYSNYKISEIKLYAYQRNNFKDINNKKISYDNGQTEPKNIFIKDIFLGLGIQTADFTTNDQAKIFIDDSLESYSTGENSEKNLSLFWIHKDTDNNTISRISKDIIPAGYEIKWYRYTLGKPSRGFSGANWEEVNYTDIINILSDNGLKLQFHPRQNYQRELIKVIIVKEKEKILTTPILELVNEADVSEFNTAEIARRQSEALGIKFEDKSDGYYYVYGRNGQLHQNEDKERILTAVFDLDQPIIDYKPQLTESEYENIKWIIPYDAMIIPIVEGVEITTDNTDYFDNSNHSFIIENLNQLTYKLKNNLTYFDSRNIIYLEVQKDLMKYTASAALQFGAFGTSGSDYNIVIDWDNDEPVFDVQKALSNDDYALKGNIKLLDRYSQEVQLNFEAQYTCTWVNETNIESDLSVSIDIVNRQKTVSITKNNDINMDLLYILKITLENFGDYNLTAYFPIALKDDLNDFIIKNVKIPTTVRYAADGTINFNQEPFQIDVIDENNEDYNGFYWQIITNPENSKNLINLPELINVKTDEKDNKKDIIYNTLVSFAEAKTYPEVIYNTEDLRYEYWWNNGNNIYKTHHYVLLDSLSEAIGKKAEDLFNSERFTSVELESLFQTFTYINKYGEPIDEDGITKIISGQSYIQYYYIDLEYIESYLTGGLYNNKIDKIQSILKEYLSTYYNELQFQYTSCALLPSSIYFQNMPLCGIQCKVKDSNDIVWTQPLYIYQDNYPSTTINQWDGKEISLEEEQGVLLARGFSAGKKNDENKFSGVILGDWSQTDIDRTITNTTGVYGLHEGAISYAFKDDGTAFIGKYGDGRILFDGNNGYIESAGANPDEQIGTRLDLKNNALYIFGNKDNSSDELYSLILNSNSNFKNTPIFQIGRQLNLNKREEESATSFETRYKNAINTLREYYTNNVYDKITSIKKYCKDINKIKDSSTNNANTSTDNNIYYSFDEYITNDSSALSFIKNAQDTNINQIVIVPKIIFDFYYFGKKSTGYYANPYYKNSYTFEYGADTEWEESTSYDRYYNDDISIRLLKDGFIQELIYLYINYIYQKYLNLNSDENKQNFINMLTQQYPALENFPGGENQTLYQSGLSIREPRRIRHTSDTIYLIFTINDSYKKYYLCRKTNLQGWIYETIDPFVLEYNEKITKIELHEYPRGSGQDGNILWTTDEQNSSYIRVLNSSSRHYYPYRLYYRKIQQEVVIGQGELVSEKKGLYSLCSYLKEDNSFQNLLSNVNELKKQINNIESIVNETIANKKDNVSINNFTTTKYYDDLDDDIELILFNSSSAFNSDNFDISSEILFIDLEWENNLISIDSHGGYLTSVDYRPTKTMGMSEKQRSPTDSQKWDSFSKYEHYGMKGFVIDLTNNRIVLGNNSSIIGYQSNRWHNEIYDLREFSISTGATFGSPDPNGVEYLTDNKNFIIAQSFPVPSNGSTVFKVDWDGNVYIRGNLTVKGTATINNQTYPNSSE